MKTRSVWGLYVAALGLLWGCDETPTSPDVGETDAARDMSTMRDSTAADSEPATDSSLTDSESADAADSMDTDSMDTGPTASCDDGAQNGTETDIDCGGACPACSNGEGCSGMSDCQSERCIDEECVSPEGTHPDIIRVVEVPGRDPGGRSWADSYSVGERCYCETTFDHSIGEIVVETPAGPRTVREVCEAIGPGPGSEPDGEEPRPLYNDIQCGNGPPNDAGDEDDCPGRVDIGRDGCGHLGPLWDLSVFE